MGSTFTKKEADHTIKRRDHRKTTISVSNVTEIYDFESKALGINEKIAPFDTNLIFLF